MSLSIDLSYKLGVSKEKRVEVFETNITSNIRPMAEAAGLYETLFRPHSLVSNPEEMIAKDLISNLEKGIESLKNNPDFFINTFSPKNGWGTYSDLLETCEKYLEACKEFPDAEIFASY